MRHGSTAQQRAEWICQLMMSDRPHGLLSQLSRTHHVSRQTLYRWKAKGEQALQKALGADLPQLAQNRQLDQQVLTLLIEAHASYRNIQTCLLKLCGTHVSLGRISGLRWNSPFQGSIDTAKHINFSFTGDVTKATLAFDGNMQSDGNIGGTYCSMNLAGKCSDYGIWSVSPAA